MIKIKNSFVLFISFLFLITPVLADINITFQSDNEKIINTFDIDNNYNQTSSNFTNEIISLPYDNYIMKLYPTNTKIISNNGSFIIKNITSFNKDWQLIIWFAVIITLIFLGFKYIKL